MLRCITCAISALPGEEDQVAAVHLKAINPHKRFGGRLKPHPLAEPAQTLKGPLARVATGARRRWTWGGEWGAYGGHATAQDGRL